MGDVSERAAAVQRGLDALEALGPRRLQRLVHAYVDGSGGWAFTGRHFDSFGHNPPYAFVPDDLIAVGFLDVPIGGAAAQALLLTRPGEFGRLLADISPDVSLLGDEDDAASAMAAAGELRRVLTKSVPGAGWTRAHKLIARKRQSLHPVYDTVVDAWFTEVDGIRYGLRDLVLAGRSPADLIERMRPPAAKSVSALRVLDIAVWMCGSQAGAASDVRAQFDVVPPSERMRKRAE